MTARPMRGEVEFRNEILQSKLVFRDLELLRIVFNPLAQFDGPTASDIVGDFDVLDLLVFHSR